MLKAEEIKSWAEITYGEALKNIDCSDKVKEELAQIFKDENIYEKYMNGESVEGIPKILEGGLPIIKFTDIFDKLKRENRITPINFLYEVDRQIVDFGEKSENHYHLGLRTKIVGRALRTFPAFLREMESEEIEQYYPEIKWRKSGPEEDIGKHADVILEYQGQEYMCWSYQYSSERATENTVDKFIGNRGRLKKGVYMLWPLDITNEKLTRDVCGWKFYNEEYMRRIKDVLDRNEIISYEELIEDEERVRRVLKEIGIVKVG